MTMSEVPQSEAEAPLAHYFRTDRGQTKNKVSKPQTLRTEVVWCHSYLAGSRSSVHFSHRFLVLIWRSKMAPPVCLWDFGFAFVRWEEVETQRPSFIRWKAGTTELRTEVLPGTLWSL